MPHLKGRLGCSCGLVGRVLRCFDGVEDVLVSCGRIHRTAHQFICTGIPLDPGRQTREHSSSCPRPAADAVIHLKNGDLSWGYCSSAPRARLGSSARYRWVSSLGPGPLCLVLEIQDSQGRLPPQGPAASALDSGAPLTPPAALPGPVRTSRASPLPLPATLCWQIWKVLSLCHLVHVLLHLKWQLFFCIPIFFK